MRPLWPLVPFGQTTRVSKRAPQEEFDLRIEAAKIVIRPSLHGFEQLGIDPKEKRFTV